jgi:hypothetical protein
LTLQCNITVKGDGRNYVWDIEGGFLDQETDGAIDIQCGNNLTYVEVTALPTSESDSNKDLWSLAIGAWNMMTHYFDDTKSSPDAYQLGIDDGGYDRAAGIAT